LLLRHCGDLVFSDPNAMDQEVHDLAGERLGWRSWAATVWPVATTDTGPELGLGHRQLVSQYV
jgi:hypothetical protein